MLEEKERQRIINHHNIIQQSLLSQLQTLDDSENERVKTFNKEILETSDY